MMYKSILSVLLVMLCIGAVGQSKKLLRTYGITKKTETTIKFENGVEVEQYVSEFEVYDENGEWIEFVDYTAEGEIKMRETRKYVKGNLVEESKEDSKGDKAEKPSYKRKTFQYVKGDVVMEESFNKEGVLKSRRTYTYTKFGDVASETKYDEEGNIEEKITYEYDDRGFRIVKRLLNSDGVVVEIKRYVYE